MPEELQRQIRSSAQQFSAEIIEAVQRAIVAMSAAFASGSARPIKVEGARKPSAAKAQKAKLSTNAGALDAAVLGLLRKSKGELGAEKINAALGTTSLQLALPIQRLLVAGKITRSGMARGTRYSMS